jgi:hypothetical protein
MSLAPSQEYPIHTPNTANIFTATAAIPGHVVVHGKHAAGITANGLADLLKAFYEAGVRRVQLVVDAAGQRLAIDAAVYRKVNRRSGRVAYWLYPLGTAQTLLRDLLHRHRTGSPRNAKRPLPVAILAVLPRPKA